MKNIFTRPMLCVAALSLVTACTSPDQPTIRQQRTGMVAGDNTDMDDSHEMHHVHPIHTYTMVDKNDNDTGTVVMYGDGYGKIKDSDGTVIGKIMPVGSDY